MMDDPVTGVLEAAESGSETARSASAGNGAHGGPTKDHGAPGITVDRWHTSPDSDVWDTVQWVRRSAVITGERGDIVFEQHDIEAPADWSPLAVNVVASKYFRGHPGSPERESSVRHLIRRVAYTIADWGKKDGYFATDADFAAFRDELTYLLLHQRAAFNSPVWFNVGLPDQPRPQCSGLLHQLRRGYDGEHPHARQDGRHAL